MTYYIMSYILNIMKWLIYSRQKRRVSQRRLAELAGVAFRSVQLLESGRHDPRVSTLIKIAAALGYPPDFVEGRLKDIFAMPAESVAAVSAWMVKEGFDSWKIWAFNFVDAFRKNPEEHYIEDPPVKATPVELKALLASMVEALCAECGRRPPPWTASVPSLKNPWFVSEMESLKACALQESPVYFRQRNIFVHENFLRRV